MKPAAFTYHRPSDVAAAVRLLAELHEGGEQVKVLAGGQSLVPMLSMRLVSPAHVVDVGALPGLDDVEVTDAGVSVGALVRHRALERHEGAHAALPVLRQALRLVAHATIRNRGTVVGSLCHADPSAELPAVLALVGGSVTARSLRGERTIAADEWFVGPLETALAEDELAVAASFPRLPDGTGTAVVEVSRRHGDYAVCGVVAAVTVDPTGRVAAVRAAYVSAGDDRAPVDLTGPLAGAAPAHADWSGAAEVARDRVVTEDDVHATAAYRSRLVAVLTERALREAADRAVPGRDAA
jgi:aerobic carbon-monoxide dehydrogenase medium subunit